MIEARLYDIKLPVRDLDQSVEFYRRVFSWLGFTRGRLWDDPYDGQKTYTLGNKNLYLELVEHPAAWATTGLDSKGIQGPRIEFLAESIEEVDDFHRHLIENHVTIVEGPKRFFDEVWEAEGMSGVVWYGVYFLDNNGIKFGLVFTNDW